MTDSTLLYGLAAEFESPQSVVEAARVVREKGFTHFEVYAPYPIKELDEIVPAHDPIPAMVLAGGVIGCLSAFALQFYIAAIDYPTNIGGRPLNSWPAFVPIMFELTVLLAALSAFFGTLWLCGLPLLHHPIFNLPEIARASRNHFFLCIETRDAAYATPQTSDLLLSFEPLVVWEIGKD